MVNCQYCKILWASPAVSKWQSADRARKWKLSTEMEMVIFRLEVITSLARASH